jgi:very-short-patch-repair endonuclease
MSITFKDKQKTLFGRLSRLRNNPTESELIFQNKLDKLHIKYIFQKGFIQGRNYCIVDFYLPRPYKLCIEIDGEYHSTEERQKRDKSRDYYLVEERGFKIIRLTNKQARGITQEELSALLSSALQKI